MKRYYCPLGEHVWRTRKDFFADLPPSSKILDIDGETLIIHPLVAMREVNCPRCVIREALQVKNALQYATAKARD